MLFQNVCFKTSHTINLIFFLITASFIKLCHSEFFTALADMKELENVEDVLLTNLKSYVDSLETKIKLLKRSMKRFDRDKSVKMETYISNPINAFLLTKRLTHDWNEVEKIISTDLANEIVKNVTTHKNILNFPTEEDFRGAAIGLQRLQQTYKITASNMANGFLNGIKYSSAMSADDCYRLGRELYDENEFEYAAMWLYKAFNRLDVDAEDNINYSIDKLNILQYLALSYFSHGNTTAAVNVTKLLYKLYPYYKLPIKSSFFNNEQMEAINQIKHRKRLGVSRQEQLCRNEIKLTPSQVAPLKCRYVTMNIPFLLIAPLKLEEASLNPPIFIYHDVLSDTEIDVIQKLAQERFERSVVFGDGESSIRTSKSGWLFEDDHEILKKVTKRVQHMTGLSTTTAENLQVVNYGIGGHYLSHYDYYTQRDGDLLMEIGSGNRIGTVMFYMSDVEQGGATVFPRLNVTIWPKKGTAAFWYNLFESGMVDRRTLHAACPVLVGNKWVANRWLHEHDQEFLRPCGLKPDDFSVD